MELWSNLLVLITTKMSMKNLTISSKNYWKSCKLTEKSLLVNTLISFPPINADMFNWRRASVSTCIHKYGDAGDIATEVETHNDNDENN